MAELHRERSRRVSKGLESRARRLVLAAVAAGLTAVAPAAARADAPPGDGPAPSARSWRERYDAARARMIEGDWVEAEAALRALAGEAPSEAERRLALELADLAAAYAARERARPPRAARRPRAERSPDELTLLYATSFLYGAGTGAWFLLQVEPDTALTATLPFAALTAAPVLAVATIDGYRKLPRGVPHAISAGVYLGLGQGVWLLGYQHARASRIQDASAGSQLRWTPEAGASVLWGAATLGGVLGGALGSSLVTTPGRVSFTASTTIWAGALTGLTAGALLPDDEHRREHAFLAGGIGYNAGLLGGLLAAGSVSPSVARVRLVDLLGIGGALSSAGLYLAVAQDPHARTAEGLAVLGAGLGLSAGWIATSGMGRELPAETPPSVTVQPAITPVRGGATLGVGGVL